MIRFAKKEEIEKIKALWDVCFPEEPDFSEYFFENIFKYKNTLIYEEKGEILSMAQMLPCEIKNIGKATYIYGACTAPQHRNKGYMKRVLEKSFAVDIRRGNTASVLIPANKELFGFYEKLGYETAFYIGEGIYTYNGDPGMCYEADYKDIPKFMNLYTGDMARGRSYWKMYIDMYKALGGKIFIRKDAYAFVSDKVDEIMYSSDEGKNKLLNFICDHLKKNTVKVTEKGNIPFGMMKTYSGSNDEKLYMNMMLN